MKLSPRINSEVIVGQQEPVRVMHQGEEIMALPDADLRQGQVIYTDDGTAWTVVSVLRDVLTHQTTAYVTKGRAK